MKDSFDFCPHIIELIQDITISQSMLNGYVFHDATGIGISRTMASFLNILRGILINHSRKTENNTTVSNFLLCPFVVCMNKFMENKNHTINTRLLFT
jgi:hypothetical protein